MISIIITSFKEPKTIGKAIESFVSQNIKDKYELYVVAPDEGTLNVARGYQKSNKNIKLFRDPGKGKSYALNKILPLMKGNILILSDGDVWTSDNSVNELLSAFKNPKIGCTTGRPVSADSKNTLLGFWSHILCDSADYLRRKKSQRNEFLECSGYLWAFRNNIIKAFPLDAAEDTIIPYLFAEKGYTIAYSRKAEVYIKYPKTLKDFIEQKKRTAKAHETLDKYVDTKRFPRMKSFSNEILGSLFVLSYPRSIKQIFWTFLLFPLRLYIWLLVYYHSKIKKQHYTDAWKRVESTK